MCDFASPATPLFATPTVCFSALVLPPSFWALLLPLNIIVFLLLYFRIALPLSCCAACLLCVCGTSPSFAPFPSFLLSSSLPFLHQVSVCQEMITEFRNAVSCKKSSRMRRRRPLGSSAALRHPTRIALGAPRPLRLVREMRLSNGKLYSGAGPLTGGAGGTGLPDLGPGPQRILDDPLGANTTPPPPAPTAVVLPARSCSHVRICQECRRIQSLRSGSCLGSASTRIPPTSAPLPRLPPPPPPSSSNTDSEGGGGTSPRRQQRHSPPPPSPRRIPAPPQSSNTTDLLGDQEGV